ncbi:succinyldiaminopimelate transaminase [Pelomonas aquatica]|jgi:N-succinyldiaminopimelate aminotransferase|uniref:Succinyldiaminopimelate transaminase n=1 Tax=Pelomonas aquatica TaxID=431058 RepID=A0A9X4R676_9BURK|nr:succinyldiaminopimelate transaminase [Pelomonas aquatica]MCY4756839.1 succinyldiaminopimelate transaminase [Pelomonas aquatica]MDG0864450.1 succinyldiaminopimelate transaminase [Pelomonas aquatica]
MNPLLDRLQPYPFERLRALTAGITPNPALAPISLGIGEPRHAAPALIEEAIKGAMKGLSGYPATAGSPALREAIAGWIARRYGLTLDPPTQVLPVNGSREALFAIAQTVIDSSRAGATVVCPNPFYQIYEGAALLAGAEVAYANSDPARNFAVDWSQIDDATWARTQLLYVCSPGNPSGAVMPLAEWQALFELSDRHGFVIASDECYSEIYFRDEAPLGGLEAAARLGRSDFRNLIAFTSLSKRSNVPGLRSGFVAGDAALLKKFLLYRTYHGSAMSPIVQAASIAAWGDEAHVVDNRARYRRKFAEVTPLLAEVLDVALPDAGFYLWAAVPECFSPHAPRGGHGALGRPGAALGDDIAFAQGLLAQYNLAVLPGSLLAREAHGNNPGAGRIRLALVADEAECLEAARRIVSFTKSLS